MFLQIWWTTPTQDGRLRLIFWKPFYVQSLLLDLQVEKWVFSVQGKTNAFVLVARTIKKYAFVYDLIFWLFCLSGGIVYVFGRLQVETLETYTKKLITSNMNWEREISFILLQLINGLKTLQAQGIEEIPATMDHFLLTRVDKDPQYRVVNILDGNSYENEPKMTLCNAALASMLTLFQLKNPVSELGQDLPELTPSVGMFRSMCSILRQGSSISNLEQVKSMLEYMLWGPSDIAFEVSSHQETREESLQRWLDLERATVLHNLIRSQGLRIQLTVFEEYHLLFLVQTCAKMLQEASLLFESEVACMWSFSLLIYHLYMKIKNS